MATFEEGFVIVNPTELREENLTKLLAVLIDRFDGEVLISMREFAMMEGVDIRARYVTSEHLRLSLAFDDEEFYGHMEEGYFEGAD